MSKKIRKKKPVKVKRRLQVKHKKSVKQTNNQRPPAKKIIVNIKKLLSLEEAIKYVTDLAGEKGLEIFKYLIIHGPIEENLLARKLNFEKANAIRKFLYRLYNKNLVSYVKKKRGYKAWYTYYWSANPERLVFLIQKEYEDEINQAKKAIDLNKVSDFYLCETCNRRYDMKEALENDFRCVNCNSVLVHMDAAEVVGEKRNRIDFLNEKIKKLSQVIKAK
jgi:transcription initiation factor TFIIE subunit alpha